MRPPSGDKARVASRLGADYLLRSLQTLAELADGELLTAVISLAIVQANIGYIDRGGAGRSFDSSHTVPPDEIRRPVSVLSLSQSLGLPYETTRRYVAKMVASGMCVRVKGGIITPAAVLDTPEHRERLRRNLANLRRLFRDLKAAGVDLD